MDFGGLLSFVEGVPVIRAILGVILVFFLPGFAWTLVFFKKLTIIERIALSVGLSIALVTLSIIVLNVLFDIRINGLNALITIIAITVIPAVIYFLRRYLARRSE
ncbi:MAG: DUF1616 domain-containing protein, partial [Dehalococcoidales bacterium]|nr:DUF1616 domain-containing protein [Dehalococcoidales bacterium]